MDARDIATRILRGKGLSADAAAEAARAKEDLDRRLDGLGLPASSAPPTKILPGEARSFPFVSHDEKQAAGPVFAADALLIDGGRSPNPRVVPASMVHTGGRHQFTDAEFEPFDAITAQSAASLATKAAGGTEIRFNLRGFVHCGSGAIGVYYNRPLGAAQNFKWLPMAPGRLIPYNPKQGMFVGTDTTGGITIAGVLNLAFYKLPEYRRGVDARRTPPPSGQGHAGDQPGDPGVIDPGGSGGGFSNPEGEFRDAFRAALYSRLGAVGSDFTAGVSSGGDTGTDVTLGTFSDAGVGTQIYLGGTNMPIGGASVVGRLILNGPPDNTDAVWVGESAALAVARNGGINASGQDIWAVPAGGKIFMLANSGTQYLGARFRS